MQSTIHQHLHNGSTLLATKMKIDKTIINEAPIGPSCISVRMTVSEEMGGFLVTLDATDRGKLHHVRQRHTFTVPDLALIKNAAKELATNYATRVSKIPQRIQHLGALRKWLLGIREWTVLSEIMVDTVAAVTFYSVQTKYGEQILLAFYRRRYQLVPIAFAEEFMNIWSEQGGPGYPPQGVGGAKGASPRIVVSGGRKG